jgi:hypothetical protein
MDPPASREEKYVTVHLNDSLKRFDRVEVVIFVAGDTSDVVATLWNGPLPDPSAIPSYRLDDGETRNLSIRVRVFNNTGILALDMLISKQGGAQTVQDLPVPKPIDTTPIDTTPPRPSVRLASLQVSPGSLSPAFDSSLYSYQAAFAYAESTLAVTASPASPDAKVIFAGSAPASGKTTVPIALKVGDNGILIKVASARDTVVYAIQATRAAAPPDTSHPDTIPVTDSAFKEWKVHRIVDIKINYLGMIAGVIVRNCPMLVRLDSANFDFAHAAAGGKDIRFSGEDGRILPHEIARWEAVGSSYAADIWVLIDSIRTDDDHARIVMHHGSPKAADASDPAKVFSEAAGFSGAWHFSEQAKGQAGEFKDAMGKNPGTGGTGDGKNLPGKVAGVVGYGQKFGKGALGGLLGGLESLLPGNAQSVITLPSGFDPGQQVWTFQVWIRRTGNTDGVVFNKGDGWVASKERFQVICLGGGTNQIGVIREGAEYWTNTHLSGEQFQMLTLVYTGSRVQVYVNGFMWESKDWTQGGSPLAQAVFGSSKNDGSDRGLTATLDEPWFSNQARSPEWIRFSYGSQDPQSHVVLVRPPQ